MCEGELLTVGEVASELKVSPRTVKRWIAQGLLEPVVLGPRTVRVRREELDRHMAAQTRKFLMEYGLPAGRE